MKSLNLAVTTGVVVGALSVISSAFFCIPAQADTLTERVATLEARVATLEAINTTPSWSCSAMCGRWTGVEPTYRTVTSTGATAAEAYRILDEVCGDNAVLFLRYSVRDYVLYPTNMTEACVNNRR